jgi:mannose-6-phosphate isomerase-like protein (cupin superfamily)
MFVPANACRDALLVKRGDGRPIHVLGNDITVKISSSHTGGAFGVFEAQTQPFQGPPLHLHRDQDEWWYILEGEYRFEVDGQEIYARAGACVFAPRGSRHTFQSIGAVPGRIVTTVVPGGIDIFFAELETAVPRGTVPDAAKMIPIFKKHGFELLGTPLAARPMTAAFGAD